MANKVYNLEGGLYSGAAFSAFETSAYGSCVAGETDYVVSAGTGMNVAIAKGQAIINPGDGNGIRVGSDSTNTTIVVPASTANPRIDTVVAYIDMSVSPSTSVVDNEDLGILKFKCVTGAPSANPSAPSQSAIQISIGGGNPYIALADVYVPKNATAASSFQITDRRVLAKSKVGTNDIIDGSITFDKIDMNNFAPFKYTNEEQPIGVWMDGKTIYRRCFEFTTGSAVRSLKVITAPIPGLSRVISVYGTWLHGTAPGLVSYNLATAWNPSGSTYEFTTIGYDHKTNGLYEIHNYSYANGCPAYAIIEYTK